MSDSQLTLLWALSRRVRQAASDREQAFLLVNDTHDLAPYRQAALWLREEGAYALSGVVQVEANAPYAQWLAQVCEQLQAQHGDTPAAFTAADLPPALAADWSQWWPAHALWLGAGSQRSPGALVLARDLSWQHEEIERLSQWLQAWWHAFDATHRPRLRTLQAWQARARQALRSDPSRPWWRQRVAQVAGVVLAIACLPVHLTVLAPGELVPANPVVLRAPLDGVIDAFHVQPNQAVKKGQPLFGFDEAVIQSRAEVASQSLATAEAEYRQVSQQALTDAKAKGQLAVLAGRVEEKRAEAQFLRDQLQRARVLAPQDGVVLMDDPSEWIGKPVAVGERILRIAPEGGAEVEAWLPIADAIDLSPGASVNLYLQASPLSPVPATLRYFAHDAVQRPEGHYAYRVRATLTEPTAHRVGLKGTAKLQGRWVPLAYWALRRPWAWVRSTLGV